MFRGKNIKGYIFGGAYIAYILSTKYRRQA